MKKYRNCIIAIFIIIGVIIPVASVLLFAHFDLGALFNSWENKESTPDWRYLFLIIYKLAIYIFPPLIGMLGFYITNHKEFKHKFIYYFVKALNVHFLVLLSGKLVCDSILELDKIWGFTVFNSIKDVQTLIGYIVTFFIKKNLKIEPGLEEPKALSTND